MFCPEVWNFKFPNDSVHVFTGLPSNLNHCENLIENHFFNHNVSVVLPNCPKVPEELLKYLIEDCDYYKVNLPISQLIEKDFISLFVCDGKLTALSVGTRIDVDDCAALTPAGTLILSLNRDTYQKLGIEGTPWGNSSTNPERYAVCIDLKKDCFKPGKPNYNKVFKSFTQLVPLRFDFIISWEPPSSHICPSSIALYLNDRGHDIRLCKPVSSYKSENVELPLLEDIEPDELIEWIGAFSLGILRKDPNLNTTSLEYLTTYDVPFDSENKSQVVMLQWTGFYTTDKLAGLFIKLRDYLVTNEGINIPWSSFNVIGFADSPVSWGLKHNSYNTSGDNNYTIIFKPEKHLITFQVTTNNSKNYKNKQSKWVFINKNEKTENECTPKEEKEIAPN